MIFFTKYFAAFVANIGALCFAISAPALNTAAKLRSKKDKITPDCTLVEVF